ncbi:hypothetical protein BDA99DRAFT_13548 [Phascolomyces articulosus]|uniref:C2H2-type domain-containing protein n=1 Tax=Phascolomyces articulosus TaxID=60185 RepID=A0AAD5PL06_9FUNG|nr:hypothetical protein BDA99DRAFT_13548 [Phascolomyces articulosus]
MSDRRNYSPVGRGGGMGYDWSDDEYSPRTHGREKFRRERSLERDHAMYSRPPPDDYDRYDRKKRHRRSITPPEERRHSKRRASFSKMGSPSHGDYGVMPRGGGQREPDYHHHQPDGDHYIPNYERDGYAPGPRYSSLQQQQHQQQQQPQQQESQNSPAFGGRDSGGGDRGNNSNNNNSGANTGGNGGNNPGYSMMGDVVNMPMMGGGWPAMGRMPAPDLDQLDYVVNFKQFCDHLRSVHSRSQFDEDELKKRYQQYKEKVIARQLSTFFNNNKDKQWFQEKYHPKIAKDRIDDMKRRRMEYLEEFKKNLENGKYDDVNYDAKSSTEQGSGNNNNEDTSAAVTAATDEKEKEDDNPEENTTTGEDTDMSAKEYADHLIIKTVPPTIARQKIIEMCSDVEGFEYVVLSEPSPNKKFHRIGWIHFKQGTDMQKAFDELDSQKIDDFVFHLAMNYKNRYQSRTSKITYEIASVNKRLEKDIDQAKQLAKRLESELGENVNVLQDVLKRAKEVIAKHDESTATAVTEENNDKSSTDMETDAQSNEQNWKLKKELDMILAYLRHVHMYCYYCALECDSTEEMNRRCVDPHVRKVATSPTEEIDPKQQSKNEKFGIQWAKNIDQKIAMKINVPDDHELERMGAKILKKETDAYVKEHVLKEHEAKYKCRVGECAKAFKGFEYVEKHIFSKHPEEIDAIKEDVDFYNNYVCDPNHLIQANNPNSNSGNMPMGAMGNGMPLSMPFMMTAGMNGGMRPPPGMGHIPGPGFGAPWDQIPRIGFGDPGWAMAAAAAAGGGPGGGRRGGPGGRKNINERLGNKPGASASNYDLDDSNLPKDPRQVKSYVDLDAPAEGDADISFY